ncbi:MAG: MmgE/PrpD family protein [Chloroflexi bacterium]|nr:MmgE/PrpD family protein [Chloroflexota bacterium]MBV9893066.1 MmgE/PrpD family protein [Chloroflexota bacterium]
MAVTVAPATTSVTEAVAQFACSGELAEMEHLYERATRAFIDTIGVTIAGGREDCFAILARTLGTGDGSATILPTRARAGAADAALLNGTAGHALDYDDVADEIKGHPSVVLVAALLALAEARGCSGRALLESYAVGFEAGCAIAAALAVEPHYRRGWHATATVGVLGAVAGAGRLLGLDAASIQNALGIAASMASGSRQNFGTMTKPLHAGLAARDAVLAIELAENGFTADPNQLDGPLGYFRMYGVNPEPAAALTALESPTVLLRRGLNVKKYPCCYGTHRMADAALALRERGLRASDVAAIAITVEPDGLGAIIHHQPRTGLQGKFSGEYVVAACLLDEGVRLSSFTDAMVLRPEAQDLLARVTIRESATPAFGTPQYEHAYATLEVTLRDGRTLRERCDIPRGDARMPLSEAELESKFRDCLAFAESAWDPDPLLGCLHALRDTARVTLVAGGPR